MTTFKKILFGLFGLYIFAALSLAHAENPGSDGSPEKEHSGQRIQEIYSQLNLTDTQKQQLESNKQDHRAVMGKIRQEMKANKEALRVELMNPKLDMPKINGLHNQIKALLSQMQDNKLASILTVRSILTPEQFTKFINLMRKHKQEHEGQEKD